MAVTMEQRQIIQCLVPPTAIEVVNLHDVI
jgi:hypothetical protein